MQVFQPTRYLLQRLFGVKRNSNVAELVSVWGLDYVCQRGGAELQGDVEEVGVGFLVVVPDDVGVVVAFLDNELVGVTSAVVEGPGASPAPQKRRVGNCSGS